MEADGDARFTMESMPMTDIDLHDIRDFILNTVLEMFDKIFGLSVLVSDAEMFEIENGGRTAASVHCAGDLLAGVVLTLNSRFANLLADKISDTAMREKRHFGALFEGCDYICGKLDSHLKDLGLACALSSPFVVSGGDFRTAPTAMEKSERFAFQYEEQVILVELGLKMLEKRGPEPKEMPKPGKRDSADVKQPDMRAYLENAVPTMFDRMFSIKNVTPGATPNPPGGQLLASSVCLAGNMSGCAHLIVGEEFAKLMTAAMFDLTPDEIENVNEIHTVIGQAGIILARNLKQHLNEIGHSPELANPLVTSGTDFTMDHLRMTRHEALDFTQDGTPISFHVSLDVPGEPAILDADSAGVPDAPAVGGKTSPNGESQSEELPTSGLAERAGRDFIFDIPLDVSAELGHASKKIKELLEISEGSVITLTELENDPVDILVNGVLVARGEVVVENGKYGVRITEVKNPSERLKTKI